MPDYPDNDNQVRTERRQNVEHDIGATPQEIRDATRDFQRRTEERIEARIARTDEPWQPPNREVKVESASLPIVPLTLGFSSQDDAAQAGGQPQDELQTIDACVASVHGTYQLRGLPFEPS